MVSRTDNGTGALLSHGQAVVDKRSGFDDGLRVQEESIVIKVQLREIKLILFRVTRFNS